MDGWKRFMRHEEWSGSFLVLLKELSNHVDELKGNILLSINPVEENMHTGIIEGLKELNYLKEKEGFNRHVF